jgi:hypothetical protein
LVVGEVEAEGYFGEGEEFGGGFVVGEVGHEVLEGFGADLPEAHVAFGLEGAEDAVTDEEEAEEF